MAYIKDYIERQIDQLIQAIATVMAKFLNYKDCNLPNKGIESINEFLNGELETDIESLLKIPEENFGQKLIEKHKLTTEQLSKLGDLFFTVAEVLEESKQRKLYKRVLNIYENLNDRKEENFPFDRLHKVEFIKSCLK